MALKKPFADYGGIQKEISSGDTIDPSLLPAASGGGVPYYIPEGDTYAIPAYTQAVGAISIICMGSIDLSAGGALIIK